jgi:hypothetical protein
MMSPDIETSLASGQMNPDDHLTLMRTVRTKNGEKTGRLAIGRITDIDTSPTCASSAAMDERQELEPRNATGSISTCSSGSSR